MFCQSCGANIPEESKVCPQCGSAVDGSEPAKVQKRPLSVFLIGGIAVAVIAIIVAVVIACSMLSVSDHTYVDLTNKHVQAILDCDSRAFINTLPRSWINTMIREEYDGDRDECYEDLEDEFSRLSKRISDEEAEISWKIADIAEPEKELKRYLENLSQRNDTNLRGCRVVTIDLTISMDEETRTTETQIVLGQIGLKWYVISPMDF